MAKFKFWLTKTEFQGKHMSVKILANGNKVDIQDNVAEFDCELPGQICIEVAGKGPYDTEVDEHGAIISDKFVRVDAVSIDRMTLPKYIVESKLFCFVPKDNQYPSATTNYFAWDGRACVDIKDQDSFSYLLGLYKD